MPPRSRLAFLYWDSGNHCYDSTTGQRRLFDECAVVKFCSRYGIEAHQVLARHGLAPKVLFYGKIFPYNDEFFFVVMELLPIARGFPSSTTFSVLQADVTHRVNVLHAEGFVHGDISYSIRKHRAPSSETTRRFASETVSAETHCSRETRVMLLDLDWAGYASEARYPADINMNSSIDWPEGVGPSPIILEEHDREMLARMDWEDVLDHIRVPLTDEGREKYPERALL